MRARDFRLKARQALFGNWSLAVGVCLVASILMGGVAVVNTDVSPGGYLRINGYTTMIGMAAFAVTSTLVAVVISGAVNFGLCRFHLNLINGIKPRFGDLFSQFHRLWPGFLMNLLTSLFVFLWSLLLIIPGMIAAFSYAMVPYLMAEFPELGVMDAIRESKRLMRNNKWRLFCLKMSFFGWAVLSVLSLGVGFLWLTPYMQAALAAFYMDVTGRNQPITRSEPEEAPVRGQDPRKELDPWNQ